ncbi:class I SAM-dependent methyltransferase [Oleiharenicola lentus]|uniref:Class I SAM-dependent methyltransferase n=1 Tax=Oleiharenicola lentus TaxID=2508720 RepID=A0A4Q1C6F6_9BACT|nr:class I SAM-dependent methyltransferase [Oleiharenicola lentus]RXK54467.1 class I SAM-dependent methyltransferase [Oleiharenicola lentus]
MSSPYDASFWDQRYGTAGEDYVFGTAPNDFLARVADRLPAGPVLCLAEGEGRNAVFLAKRGHAVTALDQSATGLAKATALAGRNGVSLATVVADLAEYSIPAGAWAGIVAIFMHLPPELRRRVLGQVAAGLQPGGVFIFESYTPGQLAFGTGGPRDVALLPTLASLRPQLPGLTLEHAQELERDVHEGGGHTGRSAVVQILARRPR